MNWLVALFIHYMSDNGDSRPPLIQAQLEQYRNVTLVNYASTKAKSGERGKQSCSFWLYSLQYKSHFAAGLFSIAHEPAGFLFCWGWTT